MFAASSPTFHSQNQSLSSYSPAMLIAISILNGCFISMCVLYFSKESEELFQKTTTIQNHPALHNEGGVLVGLPILCGIFFLSFQIVFLF